MNKNIHTNTSEYATRADLRDLGDRLEEKIDELREVMIEAFSHLTEKIDSQTERLDKSIALNA